MENHSSPDRSLEELLALDEANLETLIRRLECEIKIRKRLSDEILTILANERLSLEDMIWRMRYVNPLDRAFSGKTSLMTQRQKTKQHSAEEKIARFKDLSRIKYELQKARERLEQEKKLRALL